MQINYSKLRVTWKNNLNNIYKENTIIGVGQEAVINFSSESISNIYVNFEVDGEVYTDLVQIERNIIHVPFKTDVLKKGTHKLEIVAYLKNGDVVPSPTFSYYVEDAIENPNDITAETNYPILIQLLEEVEEWNEDVKRKEIERQENENSRISSENTRISNENTRKSNETNRQQYEVQRRVEEDERLTDEQVRVNAENIRIANENERLRKEIERQNAEELRQIAYNSSLYARMDKTEDRLDVAESQLAQNEKNINSEYINVLYPPKPLKGLKGDGVTDDRQALQDIINYVGTLKKKTYLYFPKGYTFVLNSFSDENLKAILKLNKYISINGYGEIKVSDNFGDYYTMFIYNEFVDDVEIKDITINQNTTGNIPNFTITGNSSQDLRHNHIFRGQNSNDDIENKKMIFNNVKFIDVMPVTCICILGVEYMDITNCYVEYSKNSLFNSKIDNTAIHHSGNKGNCINNTIIGNSHGVTAIEVHGQETFTSGNNIDCFDQGILIAPKYNENTNKNIVCDNILKNIKRGIVLWTDEMYGCSNVYIKNNYIYLHSFKGEDKTVLTEVNSDIQGITTRNKIETPASFENWIIEDNVIEYYKNSYCTNQNCSGINIAFRDITENTNIDLAKLDNLIIRGNIIKNPYFIGIMITSNNTIVNNVENWIIDNNIIENPCWFYNGNLITLDNIFTNVNSGIYINTKFNIKNFSINNNSFNIKLDNDINGSRCNTLIDIRLIGNLSDIVKVKNNNFNIDSVILVNTLYSKCLVKFVGDFAENDLLLNSKSNFLLASGSKYTTNRGYTYIQNMNSVDRTTKYAVLLGSSHGMPTSKVNGGIYYRGNQLINTTFNGSNEKCFIASSVGILYDVDWVKQGIIAKGQIFKNSDYPSKNFIALTSGVFSNTFTLPSNNQIARSGSVIYEEINGEHPAPVFVS